MLSAILERLRRSEDRIFTYLLKKDFPPDLALATQLTSIPMEERTPEQNMSIRSLRRTYHRYGDCPSHLSKYVSRKLQEEYQMIHDKICGVLNLHKV